MKLYTSIGYPTIVIFLCFRVQECWYRLWYVMADRKAELEKKRQKLEELKKAREHKKKEAQDNQLVGVIT